jgi:hypothetical protein
VTGLMPFPPRPTEAVELDWLNRTYRISVSLRGVQRAGPFYISAGLSWKWDAALAARSATTEENLLIEVLGRDGYYLVTEQPWLRVDLTLRATLPADAPIPTGRAYRPVALRSRRPVVPDRRRAVGLAGDRLTPPVGQPRPPTRRLA